ncbi:MAG: SPFH domain-containing protein [Bacilli bacterium]
MGFFNKNNGGFMDEIRCDEPSYLIWKWHPKGSQKGNNTRENAIRWGSSLRVKDGEVAVFVYKQKDGTMQDFIVGPFDETVKTNNLPALASIVGLAYDGGTPFQAEVYFINLAQIVQVNFAVPFFDVYDPRLEDFGVPTAVRGTISFKINDYKEFIKLHRLAEFKLDDFQNQIKDVVIRYAKDTIANAPAMNNIPLIQIETKISQINDKIELDIIERLKEDFGILVSGVDIGAIEIDKTSEGYKQLMNVTKDVTSATIQAETEAKVKNITDKQRIDIENYDENLRIQREEGQYSTHKQTQSNNLGAFQIEKQSEVGIAGANALGKMGENGAGGVDLGSGSSGFNPAAMMAGMAVGGAVGQNIAGTMNGILNNNIPNSNNMTPPPIPTPKYYIAENGNQIGPFDMENLKKKIEDGTLKKDSFVWKDGMNDWKKVEAIEEINALFPNIPPISNN